MFANLFANRDYGRYLLLALGIWNGIVFLMMAYDKLQARRGRRRVSERALLCSAAAFGAAGMWLAMRLLRHKTRHDRFRYGAPVMLAVQIGLLVWLIRAVRGAVS